MLNTTTQSLPLPLHIYPATLADLDPLTEVLARAFHPPEGIQGLFFPLRKMSIGEDMRQRLEAHLPHYCCLAAWAGHRMVGTLEISLRRLTPLGGRGNHPYISNLAVLHPWRRLGVARQLLLSAEGIAQAWGYRQIHLHVLESNTAARHLYLGLGYRVLHVTPDPWQWLGCSRQLLVGKRLG